MPRPLHSLASIRKASMLESSAGGDPDGQRALTTFSKVSTTGRRCFFVGRVTRFRFLLAFLAGLVSCALPQTQIVELWEVPSSPLEGYA